MKYQIPEGSHNLQNQWVVDHYRYLNERDAELSEEQKACDSELTQICDRYLEHTDKSPHATYYIKHNYTEFYGDLLRYYRDRKVNVLEIGVRQGGSLLMWRDYFEAGSIYGIDLHLDAVEVEFDDRIQVFAGDAYDPEVVDTVFQDLLFDVIVDDGSHRLEDQIECLNIYAARLRPGGILIIEDIKDVSDAKTIINSFNGRINKCSIVDRRHCIPSLDDVNVLYYA